MRADLVVSAVDLHFSETELLESEQQTYPETYWAKATPGPSALLLYLGVKGELPELEHHTLLFAKDWRSGFDAIFGTTPHVPDPASLYVCKPSGVDSAVAPDGHENLFVLVPIPADPSFGKGGVDGKGDKQVEALADRGDRADRRLGGIPDLASRVTVRRTVGPADFASELNSWRGTALGPAHILKQSAMFRARNVSKKVRGLYFVGGSTIPGVGLPMCLISAEVVLKRITGDRSTSPLAEPLAPGPERCRMSDRRRTGRLGADAPTPDEADVARARGHRGILMSFLYLAALLVALAGMVMLDRRFRLFFWRVRCARRSFWLSGWRSSWSGISRASVSGSSSAARPAS